MERRASWLAEQPFAHRGLHDNNVRVPENSLAAIEAAFRRGYAVECDTQRAGDGTIMVFHDADLRRMCERDVAVRSLAAAELRCCPLAGTDQTIPTLTEVLQLASRYESHLLVELKGLIDHHDGYVRSAAEAFSRYPNVRIAVMSFDLYLTRDFRGAMPDHVVRGLTGEGHDPDGKLASAFATDHLQFLSHSRSDLDAPLVTNLRASNYPVLTWTVRTPQQAVDALEWCDQITFEGFLP